MLLFKELKNLASLKKQSLMQNHIQEIDIITAQEEQLLIRLGTLEDQRIIWANKVTIEKEDIVKDLTLAELTLKYPELNSVYKELKTNIEELQHLHNTNAELIEQALKIVNYTVNLLTPNEKNTYKRPEEKLQAQPKLHLLDRKV